MTSPRYSPELIKLESLTFLRDPGMGHSMNTVAEQATKFAYAASRLDELEERKPFESPLVKVANIIKELANHLGDARSKLQVESEMFDVITSSALTDILKPRSMLAWVESMPSGPSIVDELKGLKVALQKINQLCSAKKLDGEKINTELVAAYDELGSFGDRLAELKRELLS